MPPFLNFAPTAFQRRHLEHSDRSPSQWIKLPGGIIPIAKVLLFFQINQIYFILFNIFEYFCIVVDCNEYFDKFISFNNITKINHTN